MSESKFISIRGAAEHNLKHIDVDIPRHGITVITGVSGSGKSSLAFDTILSEAQRRFFYTLSHYSRQFLDLSARPNLKSISGLSPAISLQQNETKPSSRATVGTLTDVAELIGVLFANYGTGYCPEHNLPTSSRSQNEIASAVIRGFDAKTVALCASLAEMKKGNFATQLQALADKGYVKAYIDGEIQPLIPLPKLRKEERHSIKLIIDVVKVNGASPSRLIRSLQTALEEGAGYCEVIPAQGGSRLDLNAKAVFSIKGGCPQCGFSWPKLDPRYFSANSLGKCTSCQGMGHIDEQEGDGEILFVGTCGECRGTGLHSQYSSIRLGGAAAADLYLMPITELSLRLSSLGDDLQWSVHPAFMRVLNEVVGVLSRIEAIGLGYLNLSRRILSLSGGEAQRLRLASILAEGLRGVMYILDEPSQGLHPTELESVWETVLRLKSQGNTIIIVDHDEYFMRRADYIIDLGPGGGQSGGQIMAAFLPADALQHSTESVTARLLSEEYTGIKFRPKVKDGAFLKISNASLNNLRIKSVSLRLHGLNVVTGVSGAGKSSLVISTLYPNIRQWLASGRMANSWSFCDEISGIEGVQTIELIDRKPIAKSSISMPITYLDLFTDIRKLYEQLPDSQIMGLTARSYSLFAEGGRCEECGGRGQLTLSMRFLADARVQCPICKGHRYKDVIREVKYLGKSIDEVLDMTLDQAYEHFKNHKRIIQRLEPAIAIGLGYLKMGQTSASLSGGEAQRLKLVPFLGKGRGEGSILIIDEPTCGLHGHDVSKLLKIFNKMTGEGATLIVIEHHPDVIAGADWIVDLGPGASFSGGRVLYQGHPGGLIDKEGSPTGGYLRHVLAAQGARH